MYRRDYILNEARKFAALLAKLMGLKTEGNAVEFQQQTTIALRQEFETDLPAIIALDAESFTRHILSAGYSAEKLNALSQILYLQANHSNTDAQTRTLLQKTLQIYDLLEQHYHYQTFENVARRAELEKLL